MTWKPRLFFTGQRFTCPYCYEEHSVKECGVKCSYSIIGNKDKKCRYSVRKYDNIDGYDWIPIPSKRRCMHCKAAAIQLYCSIYADKEIPLDFLSMQSLPIALLGAKGSGKSNYIGVLVNEIKKTMAGPFNSSLSLASSKESKEAYDQHYYWPLYRDGRTVLATSTGTEIPPLIFPLRFMNKKNKIVNMAALTFYDTAGENLEDKAVMLKFNRYIANAKGIILLLDPLQVPNIREKLTMNGFNTLPVQNTDTANILSLIIEVIRNTQKVKGLLTTPLALVFTKIDVLEHYNVLPSTSCLKDESEHIKHGKFVVSDFDNTNIHVKDLVENWLDSDILTAIQQFKSHSFFGVTALGNNPNGTQLHKDGIHPRRVLDPLLWLLAEKNYIQRQR